MRLYDKTFWTYVLHTGRIPKAPDWTALGNPVTPLALKRLSVMVMTPGADTFDPDDLAAKVEANTLRVPKVVLSMVPLQPQRILSDAMGVPGSLIAPVHQTIATYLKGA
jgi:hypothetical protein